MHWHDISQPTLVPVATPSELNRSLRLFFDAVVDPSESPKYLANDRSLGWVDVRDLALAITKSLWVPEVGSERIIVSAGTLSITIRGQDAK